MTSTNTPKLSPAQHAIIINWHARIRTQHVNRRTATALMRLGLVSEDWSEPGQYRLTHAGSTLRDRLIADDRAASRAAALALRAKNDARSAAFADDGHQRQPKTTRQVFDAHAASLRSGYVTETVSYPAVQSVDDLRWNDALAWPEYHDGFGWQLIPSHTLARWAAFECLDWDTVPAPDMPAPEVADADTDDDDADTDDDDDAEDDDGGPLPPRLPRRGQLVELPDGGVARIEAAGDTLTLSHMGRPLPAVAASALTYRGDGWWALPDDDADPLADTQPIDADELDALIADLIETVGSAAVERMIAEEMWQRCPACNGSGAADVLGYQQCFDCNGAGGWVSM